MMLKKIIRGIIYPWQPHPLEGYLLIQHHHSVMWLQHLGNLGLDSLFRKFTVL